MSTKTDLLTVWTETTGEPVAEVRHRIRTLSEAGLLPSRKQPLSYTDIAHALLGFTASDQHNTAPAAVHFYSDIQCSAHKWTKGEPRSEQAVQLTDQTLMEALVASLQPPLRLMEFQVNRTNFTCRLTVGEGRLRVKTKSGKEGQTSAGIVACSFKADPNVAFITPYFMMNLSRSIFFPLVDQLLVKLMNHPKPLYMGGSITEGAVLPGTTPHMEPPEASQKPTHEESSPNSSDSNPWVWPPQFNDPNGVYANEHGSIH
jgi:hypothetical protein